MSQSIREDLIEAYFAALDDEDPDHLEGSLGETFVYESLSEEFEGLGGFRTYMNDYRSFSGTDHDITTFVHGETASVAEGRVVGYDEGGERIEASFCDVFEFTDEEETLTRITVYLNDYIDLGLFEA
jgi:ketosteroid isomerase-like protein